MEPAYERAVELAPGISRVLARNPSPMTGRGTNSYLVGVDDLVALDPGPADQVHVDALHALTEGRLRYILVTHSHRDHAPGAAMLAEMSGATLLSYGSANGFSPDGTLADGDRVKVPGFSFRALHTPGHCSDHLCYLLERTTSDGSPRLLFSGDHILGGTSTTVVPPDGDMGSYFSSLGRLQELAETMDAIAPGHGELLHDPGAVIAEYLVHRRQREEQVIAALRELGRADPAALVRIIYPDLPATLANGARANVWSHLRKLMNDGIARSDDPNDVESMWTLSG